MLSAARVGAKGPLDMVVLMWVAIGEVLLDLLWLVIGSGRSGPATIDVTAGDDRRRLLIMNHGPGVARAVRVSVLAEGGSGATVLAGRGEIRMLRPEKWKWLRVDGDVLPAEPTVHVSWAGHGGGRAEATFTLPG